MSFSRQQFAKVAQVLPTGESIASYPTYAEAQKAIAYLADQHFPVESLTIVGTELTSVERVTGRLSYGRVAIAGAMSGAWFGLFVGLLMSLFGGAGVASGVGFISVGIGAGFGLLFSVLSYAITRNRRDFTSSSQIVANQYAVLCIPAVASEARRLLIASPVGIGRGGIGAPRTVKTPPSAPVAPTAPAAPPVPASELTTYHGPLGAPTSVVSAAEGGEEAPVAAPKIDSRWVTPDGKPKFGALAADHPGVELPKVSGDSATAAAESSVAQHDSQSAAPVIPPVIVPDTRPVNDSAKKDPYENDPFAPPKK